MVESSRRGVTRRGLMEKLAVVAILGLLAAVTASLVLKQRLKAAKIEQARADCKAWASAAESYISKHQDCPPSLETLTKVQADGTPPLMEANSLYDPWGREYQYDPSPGGIFIRPVVWSWGPRPNDPNSIIGSWQ
jgi:type II secretory pathway pseudopilin PulG